MTRRGFLGVAVAATAVGCNDSVRQTVADVATSASPFPSPTPPPLPPPPPPYAPVAGEALADLKLVAGGFAQAITTYDAADRATAQAALAAVPLGSAATVAAPLLVPGFHSRGVVEFVQFGGLVPVTEQATYASCMVVVRQQLFPASGSGGMTETVRTLDVRAARDAGHPWRIEELASAGGTAVAPPPGAGAVQAVLDSAGLVLPDSARWDVASGQMHPNLLAALLALTSVGRLSVTVLRSGHPEKVIDGRRDAPVSAHTLGRAVDIYAVDGILVQQLPPERLRQVVQAAGSLQYVRQIGVPPGADLDGGARRYFANLVHADHLHVAVRG